VNRRAFLVGLTAAPFAATGDPRASEAISIRIQGDSYSKQDVEDLLRSINDAVRDGHAK